MPLKKDKKIKQEKLEEHYTAKNLIRKCGSCHYCCVVYSIEELNKWQNRVCKHVITDMSLEHGGCCSIHEGDRPDCCKDYSCMWRDGLLDESTRPDKINAVFHLGEADARGHGQDQMIMAWTMDREVWDEGTEASRIAHDLAKQMSVILRPGPFNGTDILNFTKLTPS